MRKVLGGVAALALVGGLSMATVPQAAAAPLTVGVTVEQIGASLKVRVSGCNNTTGGQALVYSVNSGDTVVGGGNMSVRDETGDVWLSLPVMRSGTFEVVAACDAADGAIYVGKAPIQVKPYLTATPEHFQAGQSVTVAGYLLFPGKAYRLFSTAKDANGAPTLLTVREAAPDGSLTWTGPLPHNGDGQYTLQVRDATDDSVVASLTYTIGGQTPTASATAPAPSASATAPAPTASTTATPPPSKPSATTGSATQPGLATTGEVAVIPKSGDLDVLPLAALATAGVIGAAALLIVRKK